MSINWNLISKLEIVFIHSHFLAKDILPSIFNFGNSFIMTILYLPMNRHGVYFDFYHFLEETVQLGWLIIGLLFEWLALKLTLGFPLLYEPLFYSFYISGGHPTYAIYQYEDGNRMLFGDSKLLAKNVQVEGWWYLVFTSSFKRRNELTCASLLA